MIPLTRKETLTQLRDRDPLKWFNSLPIGQLYWANVGGHTSLIQKTADTDPFTRRSDLKLVCRMVIKKYHYRRINNCIYDQPHNRNP